MNSAETTPALDTDARRAVHGTVPPLVVRLSDSVSIIRGDCRDVLPVDCDAVVTDPPYGISFDFSKSKNRKNTLARAYGPYKTKDRNWANVSGDTQPFDPAHLLEYGQIIMWGANHYASRLPDSAAWLVWDKKVNTPADNHSDCELAWTNIGGSVRRLFHLWRGAVRAGEENPKKADKLHPAQKPVALMMWCVGMTTGTVLDPYMGSGTTGVACIRTGRKFIGIEIDPAHFATARARLENELRQGLLPLTHNKEVSVER